jgi:hypothetical protein
MRALEEESVTRRGCRGWCATAKFRRTGHLWCGTLEV